MPPAHGDLLPEAIGPYTVLGKIGASGMASIYRAVHCDDAREVALKVLAVHLAANTATRRRFQREADTLLRLQHPHILPVYDIGEADGMPYFAMRLLSERTLDDRLRAGALPPQENVASPAGQSKRCPYSKILPNQHVRWSSQHHLPIFYQFLA